MQSFITSFFHCFSFSVLLNLIFGGGENRPFLKEWGGDRYIVAGKVLIKLSNVTRNRPGFPVGLGKLLHPERMTAVFFNWSII